MKNLKKILKNWKKILIAIIIGILLIVIFVPYEYGIVFDGGTRTYTSLVYKVTKYHSFSNPDNLKEFEVGWGVVILGQPVYENTYIINEETGEIIEE